MFTRTILLALLLSGIAVCKVSAHDPGLSSAIVTVSDRDIQAAITFNHGDLEAVPDFSRAQPKQIADRLLRVRIGDVMLPIASAESESAAPNNAIFKMRWTRSGSGMLRISSGLIDQLPFGHRQLVSVRAADGASLGERLLSARENESAFEIRSAVPAQPRAGFAEFFFLGVRHILTGYDHLLFLFGTPDCLFRVRSRGANHHLFYRRTFYHAGAGHLQYRCHIQPGSRADDRSLDRLCGR